MGRNSEEEYSKEETELRFVAALRASRLVGHKPRSEMKLGKPRGKPSKSPNKRKAVEKPGKGA
jgi:hypothetical protein